MTDNLISGIVYLSIYHLVNEETAKSNTITYIILLVNLAVALCFLIIGTICDKRENKHK